MAYQVFWWLVDRRVAYNTGYIRSQQVLLIDKVIKIHRIICLIKLLLNICSVERSYYLNYITDVT